jgi:hypothetical protein
MTRFSPKSAFRLEPLDSREVPSVATGTEAPAITSEELAATSGTPANPKRYAIASGPGQTAQVGIYESGTNVFLKTLNPFGTDYTGGLNVVSADITGDGVTDVIVSAATGSSRVMAIDGATYTTLADFEANAGSKSSVFLAIGDVTGDGRVDLVTGNGAGASSTVRVYRGQDLTSGTPRVATNFDAFSGNFLGGVRVAVGDVNGDGIADIIAAPGAGSAPVLKIYTTTKAWGDTEGAAYQSKLTLLNVGGTNDRGGVFVSAGDFDGDGKADIAVGRTVGNRATVSIFKGGQFNRRLLNAFGFTNTEPGGVPVSLRDLDGDGKAELVAGGGSGVSQVRVIGARGGLARSFMAFTPNYRGGVYVG